MANRTGRADRICIIHTCLSDDPNILKNLDFRGRSCGTASSAVVGVLISTSDLALVCASDLSSNCSIDLFSSFPFENGQGLDLVVVDMVLLSPVLVGRDLARLPMPRTSWALLLVNRGE